MSKIKETIVTADKRGYTVDTNGIVVGSSGKVLKLQTHHSYLQFNVKMKFDGAYSTIRVPVHKFVAYLKFGEKIFEEGIVIRHVNGNSMDNSHYNILCGTPGDNNRDKPRHVRLRSAKIASSFVRKFTDEQEVGIRSFYNTCRSYKTTMDKFGIDNKSTLHYIIHKI